MSLNIGSNVDVRRLSDDVGHRDLTDNDASIEIKPVNGQQAPGTYPVKLCATMDDYSNVPEACITINVVVHNPSSCTYQV